MLSTNLPLRRDGMPYAGVKAPADPGVAVYFERKGLQMVFACDRFRTVASNMRAIQRTIEAIRGIERWGASDMMERSLQAFEALPPPGSCWSILGLKPGAKTAEIEAAYRKQAMTAHPDRGGSDAAMAKLNQARIDALNSPVK